MDAKILRKWGLKTADSRDSLPGSPVSQSSRDTRSATPVDVRGLQSWLPPVPIFERQRLSAEILRDLRHACALIVKETTPADADIDQTDPLEEYHKTIARAEDKPKALQVEQRTHKPRKDSPRATGVRQSTKQPHVGNVALHGYSKETSSKDRLEGLDPISGFPQPPKREPYKSTSLVNQDTSYRPPHKAVSSDYVVHESSRTSTTNPGSATTLSNRDTAITSFSQSPHDTLRNPNQRSIGFPSNSSGPPDPATVRPGSSSQQNAILTTWVTGGRSQKDHDEAVVPPLRKPESRSSLRSKDGLRSRAESIRDGIKEYIRPSSSGQSSRSGTSRSNEQPTLAPQTQSRPESRASRSSSHDNKRSWWKGGALRRKGSVTTNRNSLGGSSAQSPTSPTKDDGPDLDKSLPPMPSLDSYVEPSREPILHISQLMVPAVPTPPHNSLASPANVTSPPADMRSPMSFSTAQASPRHQTPKLASIPPPGSNPSGHSPALTPGDSFPKQERQSDQRDSRERRERREHKEHGEHRESREKREHRSEGKTRPKSKSRPHTSAHRQSDRNKAEPGYSVEKPPVSRTFFSPAHQSAAADLTQFSDAWREDLLQKEADRRLRHERARQQAKVQRKRQMEAEKGKGEKEKENAGIKNRLSRMFGSKSGSRQQAPPTTETVTEAMEPIEDRGREYGREVIAN